MKNEKVRREKVDELRRQATAIAGRRSAPLTESVEGSSPDATAKMLHELQVHQIELEMQNEELLRARDELDATRARYFDLYDRAPVGYCTLNESGLILEANLRACSLLGTARAALIRQPIFRFILNEDQDVFYLHRQRIIESGKQQRCELRMARPDGTHLWMLLESAAARGEGEAKTLRVVLSDISERKQFEAELIAARQAAENATLAKSRFLAAASHDLRQPIQAINLFNDSLVRMGLDEQQRQTSVHLSQSVDSLSDLLNGLLNVSKLDAGVVRASPEVIHVEPFFSRMDNEFSPMAARKNLSFRLCFPRKMLAILTDGRLLMSLLGNLIGNAIKYTRHGGVLVAVRPRGHQALIQVWDTGIGIAPQHMARLSEEFFQIENFERDRAKGLGLGLAIVKRLSKLLETEVICRSWPDKGSVFEFRLPLTEMPCREESRQGRPTRTEADIVAGLSGRHVVVVEDDTLVCGAIRVSLESIGMRVTTYGNAEEALSDAEIARVDFYITDFRLPGMNGIEYLEIVQQHSTKPLKAVVLTGDTSADRIDMTSSCRWTVLFKPVDLGELMSAVESQGSQDCGS